MYLAATIRSAMVLTRSHLPESEFWLIFERDVIGQVHYFRVARFPDTKPDRFGKGGIYHAMRCYRTKPWISRFR